MTPSLSPGFTVLPSTTPTSSLSLGASSSRSPSGLATPVPLVPAGAACVGINATRCAACASACAPNAVCYSVPDAINIAVLSAGTGLVATGGCLRGYSADAYSSNCYLGTGRPCLANTDCASVSCLNTCCASDVANCAGCDTHGACTGCALDFAFSADSSTCTSTLTTRRSSDSSSLASLAQTLEGVFG